MGGNGWMEGGGVALALKKLRLYKQRWPTALVAQKSVNYLNRLAKILARFSLQQGKPSGGPKNGYYTVVFIMEEHCEKIFKIFNIQEIKVNSCSL